MLSPIAAAARPLLLEDIPLRIVQLLSFGSNCSVELTSVEGSEILPPVTYNLPSTTAEERCCLAVGIGSRFVVHLLLDISYASTTSRALEFSFFVPPTAYSVPSIMFAVNAALGVGISAPGSKYFR